MTRVRRIQRWRTPWLAAALVVLLVGCSADDAAGGGGVFDPNDASGTGGSASFEGGAGGAGGTGASGQPPLRIDGNLDVVSDNPGMLVADPERSAWDLFTEDAGVPSMSGDYVTTAATCFEAPDACLTQGCSVFATCCVDNGTCCQPADDPPLPSMIDFGACDGLDLDTCAAGNGTGAQVFGSNQPLINNRGLVPGGDASAEGGAILGDPTDLGTLRVVVDVEFALPIGCGVSCLESAGVVFSGTPPGTFVDAEVGLLLSGSRDEVNLMIGNAVAETFDAGNDQTRWTLILSPEGRVEVLRNGTSQAVHAFDASTMRQASLVLFGRNLSAESNSAAIARLAFETSFCDIPSSWDVRAPVVIADDVGSPLPDERFGRGPSIASTGQETRFAYGVDGEIFWGRAADVGSVQRIDNSSALSPSFAHEALGVEDPDLVFDGNTWHLFYTALSTNGTGSIGHAAASPGEAFLTADPTPSLSDVSVSFDAPTVHWRDGLWILIARATLSTGATELRAYHTSALNTGWARIDGSLEALTRVEDPGSEITDPSLVVHNGAYQLHFSRRTGTRWTVDLLASDELLLWRPLGEALGPSDSGFDRLGARAPDAISLTDRVEVVYEGQNGTSFELGWAVRSAPSDSAPDF